MKKIEKEALMQRKKSMSKKALKELYKQGRTTTTYRTCHVAHGAKTDYNRQAFKAETRKEVYA